MAGKRKQEERRLTNKKQEKLIELYHNESDLWNVSSASYSKKGCPQGVLLNTKQILAPAIIINRIGANHCEIIVHCVYERWRENRCKFGKNTCAQHIV